MSAGFLETIFEKTACDSAHCRSSKSAFPRDAP